MTLAACNERPVPPASSSSEPTPNPRELSGSCLLPTIPVNIGSELDSKWGRNGAGAFPFTRGGTEPEPGNVALALKLNFKLSGEDLSLISVTGETPAGDRVYFPALVKHAVVYGPPAGGYSPTPERYRNTGCDSLWSAGPPAQGGVARQNPDGTYTAQCATVAMDSIPFVLTFSGNEFTSDFANPALTRFSDAGKTGRIDPNSGRISIDQTAYSSVTRGWELAARLEEAGVAKFTPAQVPWSHGQHGQIDGDLVRQQIDKFGATESNSGSDYVYRTDGYSNTGEWKFSHGHYAIGIPKSGPGRLSAGIAMFRIEGSQSSDKKTITVKNFSYAGSMLVCPASGQECTASPARSFTRLGCSLTF